MKTVSKLPLNISRRLLYTIVSGVVSYVLTRYAASIDPDTSALITGLVASIFGYSAPADTTGVA